MTTTIEFHGHTVVAPILGKGQESSHPLEDYFLDWKKWFKLEEQKRKDEIRGRDDDKCLICGQDAFEVHEIITKGAAGGEPALVPWNMVCTCRDHHTLLQKLIWSIYHFDPLNKENGLIVIGADGKPVKKMWFYTRPDPEMSGPCHADLSWLTEWWKRRRGEEWEASIRLMRLKQNEGYRHLGAKSHKAMLSGAGTDTALCKRLEETMRNAIEKEVQDKIILLDSDRAAKILDHVPQEHLGRVLIDVSGMSKADYIAWYDEHIRKAGSIKPIKRHAITVDRNGAVLQDYEVEPGDPEQGMDADVVIDGGQVVKGNPQND